MSILAKEGDSGTGNSKKARANEIAARIATLVMVWMLRIDAVSRLTL